MPIDITTIIVAFIGLLALAITVRVMPWLKAKAGAARWEQLESVAWTVVYAAEQLADTPTGKAIIKKFGGKLEYATARINEALAKVGLTYDAATVRDAIEAAVKTLPDNEPPVGVDAS